MDDLPELLNAELTGTTPPGSYPTAGPTDVQTYTGQGPASSRAACYRLDRRLGGGSQAVVFSATRLWNGQQGTVAIKVWRPSFVGDRPDLAHMVVDKEVAALARLNESVPPSPFVIRLLDLGQVSVQRSLGQSVAQLTLPWLALEYVHGGALGSNLEERVHECIASSTFAMPPGRTRRLLEHIVQGLLAVHEMGVVHRDIKPGNVLICGTGEHELAKVADFGLARPQGMQATFGGAASVGTPGYAAPEQFRGDRIGIWSDVFSTAAVCYFMLTGEQMFEGNSDTDISRKVFVSEVTPLASRPRLHPEWRNVKALPIIDQALRAAVRHDLSKRTASIAELWTTLEPLFRDCETEGQARIEAASAKTLRDAAARPWSFHVRPPPANVPGLRAVAFDPDGRGLGLADAGLVHWDGTSWRAVSSPPGAEAAGLRVLRRLGPDQWFACGDGGRVAMFTPRACSAAQQIGPADLSFRAAAVVSARHFAVCGNARGAPPVLYLFRDGFWQAPFSCEGAAAVADICVLGETSLLLVGSTAGGRGWMASYDSDQRKLTPWPIDSAALSAATVDSNGTAYAVGAGGFAFRKHEGHPALERVLSHRDLSVISVDPADTLWTAAPGRVLQRPQTGGTTTWSPLWSDDAWTARFVSLEAHDGVVVAAAENGAVVMGHQSS